MSTVSNAADPALRARAAAHQSWANTENRSTRTRPAREAFLRRFERLVDPNLQLPAAERERRAEHARRAYFLTLARKSAAARRIATSQPGQERLS